MITEIAVCVEKNIISLRYAGSLGIVANAHAWLQELYFWQTSRSAFLRSVVIFVEYREASTCTISPNFIRNWRNSFVFAFWRPQRGGAVKGEGRARASSVGSPANQGDSPGQPKRSLRAGTCVRYNYHVPLVAI